MTNKPVMFEHEAVKEYFEKLLGVPRRLLHKVILPAEGKELVIEDIVYKVVYTRTNPYRVTLEPIGVVDGETAEVIKEGTKKPADHFKPVEPTK